MTWQNPNAYARQTMQNPLGFAARTATMRAGGEPPPPQPPPPPGTQKCDCPVGSDCCENCDDPVCCAGATVSGPRALAITNPIINAARAFGRLMVGAPNLRGRKAATAGATLGAPVTTRRCPPDCGPGKICHNGRCIPRPVGAPAATRTAGCRSSDDCPPGEWCGGIDQFGYGICEPLPF